LIDFFTRIKKFDAGCASRLGFNPDFKRKINFLRCGCVEMAKNDEGVRAPPRGMMLFVLRAVGVLSNAADAFAIRDYISRAMGCDIPTAQIAIMLLRLERRGYVSSQVPEPNGKSRRGRPRKTYSLTPGGQGAVDMAIRFLTTSDHQKEVFADEKTAAA
jgi:hypothetical protein